jgi:alpha-ribazole phosphatase
VALLKTLTLIRHTKPDISPGICYGQMDINLAESFTDEAAKVSGWLLDADLIITSPLLRARRLAEYLALRHQCELHSHAGLMEMHFGDWEGRAWNDIPREEIDSWNADVLHYTPPNGESAQQMMGRVKILLQDLILLPQQHIAIVAHGGSIRAVLAQLAALSLSQTLGWQIEYGAVINTRGYG